MKIGIFLQETTPESGGAFTFAETVISGLVSAGISDSITVFHYGDAGKLKEQLGGRAIFCGLGSGGPVRFIKRVYYRYFSGGFQRLSNQLFHSFGLRLKYPAASILDGATRDAGIDLLWFPTSGSEPVECPYVCTIWDLEHRAQPYFPEVSAGGEWNLRDRYFSQMLKRASYIITGTEVGRREICQFYGTSPERIRLLPHPTPSFALATTQTFSLSGSLGVGSPYVVYPAQFWAHKNHVGLLNSIAVLRDRGLVVHCALVGSDKGNRKYIEQVARELKIEKQVHFLGFVSREDLISLYQNALALVYSSLCGPENLPPLEAMALSCPVIASDIEGAKEQLGSAAVLVRGSDANAVADAIQGLHSSEAQRKELIQKGHARAKSYTDKEFVRDLAKIFDEFRAIRKLWG
jgi:glycosyltransferase involved in cell wall biosynthesis